jgi:hypothetical protein
MPEHGLRLMPIYTRRLYDDSDVQCRGNTHREDIRHQ